MKGLFKLVHLLFRYRWKTADAMRSQSVRHKGGTGIKMFAPQSIILLIHKVRPNLSSRCLEIIDSWCLNSMLANTFPTQSVTLYPKPLCRDILNL